MISMGVQHFSSSTRHFQIPRDSHSSPASSSSGWRPSSPWLDRCPSVWTERTKRWSTTPWVWRRTPCGPCSRTTESTTCLTATGTRSPSAWRPSRCRCTWTANTSRRCPSRTGRTSTSRGRRWSGRGCTTACPSTWVRSGYVACVS